MISFDQERAISIKNEQFRSRFGQFQLRLSNFNEPTIPCRLRDHRHKRSFSASTRFPIVRACNPSNKSPPALPFTRFAMYHWPIPQPDPVDPFYQLIARYPVPALRVNLEPLRMRGMSLFYHNDVANSL